MPFALDGAREIKFADAAADFVRADFEEDAVVTDAPAKEPAGRKAWRTEGLGHRGIQRCGHTLTLLAAQPVDAPADAKLIVSIEQQSSFGNHTLGHSDSA